MCGQEKSFTKRRRKDAIVLEVLPSSHPVASGHDRTGVSRYAAMPFFLPPPTAVDVVFVPPAVLAFPVLGAAVVVLGACNAGRWEGK